MVILGLKTGYLRVTHPFAMVLLPFDLHVLGTPPALILSQDQTLQKKFIFSFVFSLLLNNSFKRIVVCNSCSSYIVFKDLATLYNSALVYFITLKFNVNNYFIIFI